VFDRNYDSTEVAAGNTVTGYWGQRKQIESSDKAAGDRFGATVAVYGDWIVVGAPMADPGSNPAAGKAYFFERNQGGADNWGQVYIRSSDDPRDGENFGVSLSCVLVTRV